MNQTTSIILLVVLAVVLAGHYVSQKLLLKKGWEADSPQKYIKRLIINGSVLMVLAVTALLMAEKPYGLVGILLFIEGAVCIAFARKLNRKQPPKTSNLD